MIVPGAPTAVMLASLRPKPVDFTAVCPTCSTDATFRSTPFSHTPLTEMTPGVRSRCCVLTHVPCGPCPCHNCRTEAT